jgi:hypothetical protein
MLLSWRRPPDDLKVHVSGVEWCEYGPPPTRSHQDRVTGRRYTPTILGPHQPVILPWPAAFLAHPGEGHVTAPAALPPQFVMGVPAEDCAWLSGHNPLTRRQLPAELVGTASNATARDMPSSISFEGCGAAISYHLAVYEAACQAYGRQRLQSARVKFVGTSSGSIAALIAALGLDARYWTTRLLQLWVPMGEQCKGLLQVDYYVGLALDEILASFPGNAADHCTGRLFVSMTHFPMKNVLMSTWKSNGHIKKCILASCFIPVAFLRPVPDGKCIAIDGGFSLNNPRLDSTTCLVSPTRSPGADIVPAAKARFRDLIGAPHPKRFRQVHALHHLHFCCSVCLARAPPPSRGADSAAGLAPAQSPPFSSSV